MCVPAATNKASTGALLTSRWLSVSPVLLSEPRTVPAIELVTICRPSGLNDAARDFSCLSSVSCRFPDAASHTNAAPSSVDNTILALGHTRSSEAVPVLVEKLQTLTPQTPFAHFRVVALALERIGDRRAAEPLADLLAEPEIGGYAQTSLEHARQLFDGERSSPASSTARFCSLREVALARALVRCGDHEGLGEKPLTEYARDLRGHFARHARAVLETPGR